MRYKFRLRFSFLILCFFALNVAFGQGIMDKIVEEVCQEFEKTDLTQELSHEEINKELELVFGTVIIRYVDEINEEYNINILEGGAEAEKFGETIGIELVKKCDKFMEIAMLLGDDEVQNDVVIDELNGKLLRIEEKGDFSYLIVKDADKREHKLLWYEHFEGAEQIMNNPKKLKGKKVKVTYKKMEVYSPKIKDYRIIKQLLSFELK